MEPRCSTTTTPSRAPRLAVCLVAALLPSLALAAQDPPVQQLEIFNGSALYKYQGCFNETVDLPGTARERALPQGAHKVAEGTLTALDCLAFCATSNNGSTYKYAGIEYSRECWCGNRISSVSVQRPDAECNTPCDGNKTQACGGALKLSIYMISAASSSPAVWSVAVAAAMAASMLLNMS